MLRGKLSTGLVSDYPDALGYLAGSERATIGALQCAIGTAPAHVVLGQPFEILVAVQQLSDQPIKFQATLRLPYRTASGDRVSFAAPQLMLETTIAPGDCVLLHFPVMAQLPTPGDSYALSVQIQAPSIRANRIVRDPLGGRAPTAFSLSPLRMQILRSDVTFSQSSGAFGTGPDVLQTTVNIMPGEVVDHRDLTARIDQIWTPALTAQDRAQVADLMAKTTTLAAKLKQTLVYAPLLTLVPERFQRMGMSLLPGESAAIAKIMTYAIDAGATPDNFLRQDQMLWYRHLTYFVESNQSIDDPGWLLNRLFGAVLYDAVRIGWHLLVQLPKHPTGLRASEGDAHAGQLLDAWQQHKFTAANLYLPLIMAGIVLLPVVRTQDERVWRNLNALREAWQVRSGSLNHEAPISALMPTLLTKAEEGLIEMRILPS